MSDAPYPRVGAVIVTFRRLEVMLQTLEAVLQQSARLDCIVVVDNDDDNLVRAALMEFSERVHYLPLPGNHGSAAGLAAGMKWLAANSSPDWYWLLDDDSPPAPHSLGASLEVAATFGSTSEPLGIVGNRGGHVVRGRIRHDLAKVEGAAVTADFSLVDGAIISAAAVAAVGLPRADLFIMMEDIEYTTRIRMGGFRLVIRPMDGSTFMHLGSAADWRGYYQARNHLRIAIDRRDLSWAWGWFLRESAIGLHLVRAGRLGALRLRWRGARHALLNRMGKTIDPVEAGSSSRPPVAPHS